MRKTSVLWALCPTLFMLGACQTDPSKWAGPGESPRGELIVASIDNFPARAVRQHEAVWCWAACAQMVLSYHGIQMSQEEIVERIHASARRRAALDKSGDSATANAPPIEEKYVEAATFDEICWALNPDLPSIEEHGEAWFRAALDGRPVGIGIDAESFIRWLFGMHLPISPKELVSTMEQRHPAVMVAAAPDESTTGHAYVVFGVKYEERTPDERPFVGYFVNMFASPYRVHEVHAIDPYTGQPVTFTGVEANKAVLFVSKAKAREIYENKMKALPLRMN